MGDLALQHVAGLLLGAVRATDYVCRYGGEEFAILLPETNLGQALAMAERTRRSIESRPGQPRDTRLPNDLPGGGGLPRPRRRWSGAGDAGRRGALRRQSGRPESRHGRRGANTAPTERGPGAMTVSRSKFVGVDGCPYGWFGVGLDNGDGYEVKAFRKFRELLDHYAEACLVLVDIPIGLLEDGPGERTCDPKARKVLGDRRSSVFPVPTRSLVCKKVANSMNYACTNKLSKSTRDKGITLQTYHVMDKIAEVDTVLLDRGVSATPPVREVHPEVCFWALNNRQPMRFRKQKREGEHERLRVLQGINPQTQEIYDSAIDKYLRKQVARDDILDALAAAVTAKLGLGCPDNLQLRTLPECPPSDCKGLPMEMVYVVRT